MKTKEEEFTEKIQELSGQNVLSCIQCGKCTAGCPSVPFMDIVPRQVVGLVQLGLEDKVLNSKTIWVCASCLTCDSRCPKGIDVSRVMESLRVILLRKGVDHVELLKLTPSLLTEAPQQALVSASRKFTAY